MSGAPAEALAYLSPRFRLVRELGRGGMGVVYEAEDLERGIRVALKTLPKVTGQNLLLFKNEFRSLTGTTHRNLVGLYELLSVEDQWFFTMELIAGTDLLRYVRMQAPKPSGPSMPFGNQLTTTLIAGPMHQDSDEPSSDPLQTPEQWRRMRESLVQLVQGISALHSAGKIHRDIKPSNILVTNEGRVTILDFGLVVNLDRDTGPRFFGGTPMFMAPEQLDGHTMTASGDWYSVGAVLYEAMTGTLPYGAAYRDNIIGKRTRRLVELNPKLYPQVPDDLRRLCLALLNPDPLLRPHADHILAQLGAGKRSWAPESAVPENLLGRDEELAQLQAAFDGLEQGKAISAFVHGYSGMGKSMLVESFLDRVRQVPGALVISGRCYEQESVPFKAFDSLLDQLSQALRELDDEEAAEVIPSGSWALAVLFPVLRTVEIIAESYREQRNPADAQTVRRRAASVLRTLLDNLARRRKLILHIDDVQWGDLDSAQLLVELLRPPDQPRLMFVFGYRRENVETSACLQYLLAQCAGAAVLDVPVNPLSGRQAEALALAILGSSNAAAMQIAQRIALECEGSPFFVIELATIAKQQSAQVAAGNFSSLDELLRRNIARLSPECRRLIEVMAIAAQPLRQSELFAAAGLPADPAYLTELRAERLIRSSGWSREADVDTYHDRIREAAGQQLTPEQRKRGHRSLATVLEANENPNFETVAVHFAGAGETEKAGGYYARAADRAAAALAFDRAAKLFKLALELALLDEPERRRLRRKLASALADGGRGEQAAELFSELAKDAEGDEALELRRQAAYQYCITGHMAKGRKALEEVVRQSGIWWPNTEGQAIASLIFHQVRIRARGLTPPLQASPQIPANLSRRLDVIWSAATGLGFVEPIRGAELQSRNLLLALSMGDHYRLARALVWEATVTAPAGAPVQNRIEKLTGVARQMTEQSGDPYLLGLLAMAEGSRHFGMGDFTLAREPLVRAEQLFREQCSGANWELLAATTFHLWTLNNLGQFSVLMPLARTLKRDAKERGNLLAATNIAVAVESVGALVRDQPREAFEMLTQIRTEWQEGFSTLQEMMASLVEALCLRYESRYRESLDLVERSLPKLRKSFHDRSQMVRVQWNFVRAQNLLDLAANGQDRSAMLNAARKAAAKVGAENVTWARAHAQNALAGIATVEERNDEAVTHYRSALELYRQAGMGLATAAVQRRLSDTMRGDEGQAHRAESDAWYAAQGIVNAEAMTAFICPGTRD